MPTIDNYWNRHDEKKGYTELMFRDGYGAQASEQNEMQSIIGARITKLGRALFKDGDIVNGAQIVVDVATGQVTATAGEVFLSGQIWSVPAASFAIPSERPTDKRTDGPDAATAASSGMRDPNRNISSARKNTARPASVRTTVRPEGLSN